MLQYLMTYLQTVLPQEEGQDLAEYAILLGLIAIIVVVAVGLIGTNLSSLFSSFGANIGTWFGS